jgi:hypothetical protein
VLCLRLFRGNRDRHDIGSDSVDPPIDAFHGLRMWGDVELVSSDGLEGHLRDLIRTKEALRV